MPTMPPPAPTSSLRRVLPSTGLTLVLLATAGCTATGTFFDPTAQIKAAVAEALDDLADQPALHITGSIYLTIGMNRASGYDATVLADGTAWSEFEITDAGSGTLVSVDGGVHINAEKSLWTSEESGAASLLGGNWLRVPTDDWHDPGSFFRPERFADLLRTEMAEADSLEIPTPAPETVDGVEVFRVAHDEGLITVTAEAPHRFVSVDELPLRIKDPVTSVLTVGDVTVKPASDDQLADLSSGILAALPEMERPYSITANPRATADNIDIKSCVHPTGCTITVDVEVDADADDPHTEDLLVVFRGELYDWDSEELIATCEKTRSVVRGSKIKMNCVAKPDENYSGQVFSWAVIECVGQYTYDTEAAIEYVTEAMAAVTTS